MNLRYRSICIAVSFLALTATRAQTPQSGQTEQDLLTLLKQVQAQQAQIVANQTKIETKLADLAETIRVARIYSSRSR